MDVKNFEENGVITGKEVEQKRIGRVNAEMSNVDVLLEKEREPLPNSVMLAKNEIEVSKEMNQFVLNWLDRMCRELNLEYEEVVSEVKSQIQPYLDDYAGETVMFTGNGTDQGLTFDELDDYKFE